MPRKSHRRRRRDRSSPPKQSRTSYLQTRPQAEEEQDQLRQESLRQHINKALTGRRMPPVEQIIKEQGEKWKHQQQR